MKVNIIHTRFEQRFGRSVGFGNLVNAETGESIADGSFAQLLAVINRDDLELENAQDLFTLLIELGFAS